jgi:hypothetical protein
MDGRSSSSSILASHNEILPKGMRGYLRIKIERKYTKFSEAIMF